MRCCVVRQMIREGDYVEGVVSLWVAVSPSREALEKYTEIDYSTNDMSRLSLFADDFPGVGFCDEDNSEADISDRPTRSLAELLSALFLPLNHYPEICKTVRRPAPPKGGERLRFALRFPASRKVGNGFRRRQPGETAIHGVYHGRHALARLSATPSRSCRLSGPARVTDRRCALCGERHHARRVAAKKGAPGVDMLDPRIGAWWRSNGVDGPETAQNGKGWANVVLS